MSGGPRPPVPGLIPLAALSRRAATEQQQPPSSIDAASAATSTGGSRGGREARASTPGRRRHHHRRRAAVGKQIRSSSPALDRPPRVNPIFVWVRQEDTRIVDVKCEDYDKRNRILLTKTAHGWRAIPRTEMLAAPRASAEERDRSASPLQQEPNSSHHRHHHKRRSRKSKNNNNNKSASVQFPDSDPPEGSPSSEPSWVTSENVNIESLLPSHTIHVKRTPSPTRGGAAFAPCNTPDKVCDVSPLDNLLAVAELELKQHIQSGSWTNDGCAKESDDGVGGGGGDGSVACIDEDEDEEDIDELLKSKAQEMDIAQIDLTEEDPKSQGCSYNDEDEMSMNDILSRLEQSLQSPQAYHPEHDQDFDDEPNPEPESDHENDPELEEPEPELKPEFLDIKEEYHNNNQSDNDSQICDEEPKYTPNLDNDEEEDRKQTPPPEDITEFNQEELKTCADQDEPDIKEDVVDEPFCLDNVSNENLLKSAPKPDDNDNDHIEHDINPDPATKVESSHETHDRTEHQPQSDSSKNSETIQEEQEEERDEEEEEEDAEEESMCLDLSIKKLPPLTVDVSANNLEEGEEGPTDLSIRKDQLESNRPPSRNSEAVQSPQPSGIPAVPPSPDIVSTSNMSSSKSRSIFLESLLSSTVPKMPLNSEVTITKQKEPLDLGKCRKSASPTVTCSEEITRGPETEPPLKKLKTDEITLKNLLDKDLENMEQATSKKNTKQPSVSVSSKLTGTSKDTQDPLSEYKQLLHEVDVPNPLMVPKDCFQNLLKHPRKEILKILSGQSDKNISLDDILVVYKDRLLAALESGVNSATPNQNKSDGSKGTAKTTRQTEKNNNEKGSGKRKYNESKNANVAPDTSAKNILANDIEAANEAALNPLFWSSCPLPFEAMANYQNHNEFIQALYAASSLPYLPNQLSELHPGLQMILGNKVPPPVGFPSIPPVNFNNPLELQLWQEAMTQASMLRGKNPYENSILNQPSYRSNLETKRTHGHQSHSNRHHSRVSANDHNKNMPQNQSLQQQSLLQGLYGQNALNNQSGWQNPYLGLGGFQQGSNNLALNVPPTFNPFSHKNNVNSSNKHNQQMNSSFLQNQNKESALLAQFNEQEKRLHQQMMQEQQKMQQIQQEKMLRQQHQQLIQQQQQMLRQSNGTKPVPSKAAFAMNPFKDGSHPEKPSSDHPRPVQGPIDLSGVQNVKAKSKGGAGGGAKSNATKLLLDDVPEVGSTTGNLEELQEAHALWHPLFGSHNKGYNPWNLPSVTATGE